MTTPTPDEICERLRRSVTDTTAFCPSPVYRNPDGPEAADLIQQQQATIERLSAALEEIASDGFSDQNCHIAAAALGKDAK